MSPDPYNHTEHIKQDTEECEQEDFMHIKIKLDGKL